MTQIIVCLSKTFILRNKVMKHNWAYDPFDEIKYLNLSYLLIKY
jgi:hypothetical protein